MIEQSAVDSNQSIHLGRIFDAQKITLIGVIIAIFIFFTIFAPNFLTAQTLMFVILKVSTIIIVATAATLLMITGNFDLSVGSVLAFSGIMHAYMAKHESYEWGRPEVDGPHDLQRPQQERAGKE